MNIYDMAKEAGVSIATISRVVNGKSVVSPKTREKVLQVLEKHNYTPNEIARGLVVNSMRTVGIMTIDIRDVYYAFVAHTAEQKLSRLGYNVILCNTGGDTGEKIRYMKSLVQKKVDGIILVGSVFKDAGAESFITEIARKLPVVMINGYIDAPNIYSVICDDAYGTAHAVDYAASTGRKLPVYFQDSDTYSARSKLEGFKEGMSRNNLEITEHTVLKVEKGIDGGMDGIRELISKKCSFDTVICGDDINAVGAVKSLKKNGFQIPDRIAVIGFNNSILSRCCDPELTSVDSMMEKMGEQAVKILALVFSGEKPNSKTVFKPKLILRESS